MNHSLPPSAPSSLSVRAALGRFLHGVRLLVLVFAATLVLLPSILTGLGAEPFDAVPFGIRIENGAGVQWQDPREVHRVVAHFKTTPLSADKVHLEYWGSWWPERHLPKDREPGGGDIGWLELGNWYKYGWRKADTELRVEGNQLAFTFRPVNAKEFPKVSDYPAAFRYTLKIRVTADGPLPELAKLEAFTDSELVTKDVDLVFASTLSKKAGKGVATEAFNGKVLNVARSNSSRLRASLQVVSNADPNTFDRTLVTVQSPKGAFTFRYDDLREGPLFIPKFEVAVLPPADERTYAQIAAEQRKRGAKSIYERVADLPEQTWQSAWGGMPPKKSYIYFPLGLDGGRQRFRLNADGSIQFRSNDHYLNGLPGKDTPRLKLEGADMYLGFGIASEPTHRTLAEEVLPICITTWEKSGCVVQQTAFVTSLDGSGTSSAPPADTFTVLLARFSISNTTAQTKSFRLPLEMRSGERRYALNGSAGSFLKVEDHQRIAFEGNQAPTSDDGKAIWDWTLAPGQNASLVLKVPYVVLTTESEEEALSKLDFEQERSRMAGYWRKRVNESARLITPESMLNEFYRSHAMHLLVNCEREPGSDRRFARVGSFGYGAYGNESCMMVVDLERRGYHKEAQDCLDAWLHYQSTVELPGSFAGKQGVLYGAAGYEAGGYNQHHGWILWMMAEHYRFTRDAAWLKASAPGIIQGADWILRETARTADRQPLERGLLPAGSLEDIGDWWTWLSTSCYSWRALDSTAWALEQIGHPEAARIRKGANEYHQALLTNFNKASELAPVVRLRNGTAVPKIPSHVHRRGRCFGWICETLEGSIHLLITGAIDPKSEQATWILQDYEDNLYLSNQYGYTLENFDKEWFSRGGMSMQACLLLDVEPYLYRDDVKHALRAMFNGQAVSYFPDVRMNTEHALPEMGDWRGDHFKSSDESNIAGWLRYVFVREEGSTLLVGQAIPRSWLSSGQRCGIERTSTWFGPTSVVYEGGNSRIEARLEGPQRNPPTEIKLRFRHPQEKKIAKVLVNGKKWTNFQGEWVNLPGGIGTATVIATY